MIQLPKFGTFDATIFGTITLGTLHRGGRRLNDGQFGAANLARHGRNWVIRGPELLRGRQSFTSDRGPPEFYSLNLLTCRTQRLRSSNGWVKNSMINEDVGGRNPPVPKKSRRDMPGGKLTGRHNKERIRIRSTMGHPRAGAPNRQ